MWVLDHFLQTAQILMIHLLKEAEDPMVVGALQTEEMAATVEEELQASPYWDCKLEAHISYPRSCRGHPSSGEVQKNP